MAEPGMTTYREMFYEMVRLSGVRGRMFVGSDTRGVMRPVEPPPCDHREHEPALEVFGLEDVDRFVDGLPEVWGKGWMTYSVGDNKFAFLPPPQIEEALVLRYSLTDCRPVWIGATVDEEEDIGWPVLTSDGESPYWGLMRSR
jgi:hypothetical protein